MAKPEGKPFLKNLETKIRKSEKVNIPKVYLNIKLKKQFNLK